MRVLMFREWNALPYSATFSTLHEQGVGGTEFQLLLHSRTIVELGHEVAVVGVTHEDVIEKGILFRGSTGKEHLDELLLKHHTNTEVIFTNVTQDLTRLRAIMPSARIVQVCQNGPHFDADPHIDVYAFVGHGQFAYYSDKFRKYRRKFMMLPNVPPWYTFYSGIADVPKQNQVIWVGSFEKQGLRRWAKAMQGVLKRHSSLKWILSRPSYSSLPKTGLPSALSGINLPLSQFEFKNMTIPELALEIKRSKVLLASLGGEDGPVSYLDGHALGIPVLCGDDIVGKFSNPEGAGLRCTTVAECEAAIEFLLGNPAVCERMGRIGTKWIINNLTEHHQASSMEHILSYLELTSSFACPVKSSKQSDHKFSFRYWIERAEIKLQAVLAKRFIAGK